MSKVDINYEYSGPHTISIDKPEVNLQWESVVLDFRLQISKSLMILTPYLGFGGSYAKSSAGYSVDAKITHDNGPLNKGAIADIKSYLKDADVDSLKVSSSGISSMLKSDAFSFRLFGGLALNLVAFKLDFTGIYCIRDNNFGASAGFRFQL